MNSAAITKSEIIQELSRIPENDLLAVKSYLDAILRDLHVPLPLNQSLKGIWKDVGFENMLNLEEELRQIRQQLQEIILERAV